MSDEEYYSPENQLALKQMVMGISPELYNIIWREAPREITIAEIKEMEDRMAIQTEEAFKLGFDAVEIHSPHGYLIHQFLSPIMNNRVDEYGGSLENRARFLTNIITKIRERVGRDKPVWCRLSGADLMPGGATHEDQCRVAAMCTGCGSGRHRYFPGKLPDRRLHLCLCRRGKFHPMGQGFQGGHGTSDHCTQFH